MGDDDHVQDDLPRNFDPGQLCLRVRKQKEMQKFKIFQIGSIKDLGFLGFVPTVTTLSLNKNVFQDYKLTVCVGLTTMTLENNSMFCLDFITVFSYHFIPQPYWKSILFQTQR